MKETVNKNTCGPCYICGQLLLHLWSTIITFVVVITFVTSTPLAVPVYTTCPLL